MHGDLAFEDGVLERVLASQQSCMTVSSTAPIPEKDFKAVILEGRIRKVGIEFFESVLAAQPLYKLFANDWLVWLKEICAFCESGDTKCYAENAFNAVSERCKIFPLDVKDSLCAEIDNPEDWEMVKGKLQTL